MLQLHDLTVKKTADILFMIAWTIELILMLVEKSDLPFSYESYIFRLTFLITLVCVFLNPHSKREWLIISLIWIFTFICYRITGKNDLLRIATFLIAAKDIDLNKAVKYTFMVNLAGTAIIMLSALLGFLGTIYLVTDYGRGSSEELRFVLGFGHPNTLFSSIYALILMWIWVYGKKSNAVSYLVVSALSILLALITASRTGTIILFITVLAAVIARFVPSIKDKRISYILIGLISPVICVILSVLAAIAAESNYKESGFLFGPWFWKVDPILTYRMSNLYYNSKNHGAVLSHWKLFSDRASESFFDMGWVRLYYWYGIIPATLIAIAIIALLYVCWKKKDLQTAIIILSLGIYTLIEATFVSSYVGRNFMLLVAGVYLWQIHKSNQEVPDKAITG